MVGSRSRSATSVLLLALLFFLPILPFATDSEGARAQEPDVVEIHIADFAFQPEVVTIPVGTTVIWINDHSAAHTVTADDGAFDSGRLDSGDGFSVTFDEPGTYAYHCELHPDMQATIVVTAGQVRDLDDPVTETPAAATPPADGESLAGSGRNLTPIDTPRLAHIHAGPCDELGIVVYSFNDAQGYRIEPDGDSRGPSELVVGTANVGLLDLFNEPFSIHVHESVDNKQNYIACAEIGDLPEAPWSDADGLVLQLAEQADSGFAGFAALRPAANGGTGVALFLSGASAAEQPVEPRATPPPGTTYTSRTFGYTITYGQSWNVSEDVSSNGRDRFVVFNGTSYVTFTGARGFNGDPEQCVSTFARDLTADPNVSNLEVAIGEDGEPLIGGTEATGAFAVYNHDYAFASGTVPYTLFVGCIPLIPNEAVLAVVQNVPTEDYDSQIEPREVLMRGLTLNQ